MKDLLSGTNQPLKRSRLYRLIPSVKAPWPPATLSPTKVRNKKGSKRTRTRPPYQNHRINQPRGCESTHPSSRTRAAILSAPPEGTLLGVWVGPPGHHRPDLEPCSSFWRHCEPTPACPRAPSGGRATMALCSGEKRYPGSGGWKGPCFCPNRHHSSEGHWLRYCSGPFPSGTGKGFMAEGQAASSYLLAPSSPTSHTDLFQDSGRLQPR